MDMQRTCKLRITLDGARAGATEAVAVGLLHAQALLCSDAQHDVARTQDAGELDDGGIEEG